MMKKIPTEWSEYIEKLKMQTRKLHHIGHVANTLGHTSDEIMIHCSKYIKKRVEIVSYLLAIEYWKQTHEKSKMSTFQDVVSYAFKLIIIH